MWLFFNSDNRLQDKASTYKGPIDVIKQVVKRDGVLGLYAGMESTFWRLVYQFIRSPFYYSYLLLRHVYWNGGYFGCIHQVKAILPKPQVCQSFIPFVMELNLFPSPCYQIRAVFPEWTDEQLYLRNGRRVRWYHPQHPVSCSPFLFPPEMKLSHNFPSAAYSSIYCVTNPASMYVFQALCSHRHFFRLMFFLLLGCKISHSRCRTDSWSQTKIQLDIPRLDHHCSWRRSCSPVQRFCTKGPEISTRWWCPTSCGGVHFGRVQERCVFVSFMDLMTKFNRLLWQRWDRRIFRWR